MSIIRKDAVTIKGNPMSVYGRQLQVGEKAPNFNLRANNLSYVTLSDTAGKVRLISVVPSLNTGLCDAQTRRFNEEAAKLGETVTILTISAEIPFVQKNWCAQAGIDQLQTLSDHMDMNFGNAYGTHIKEWRLEQRAIFVIDANDLLTHVEYVPEIAQHPDYDAALAAVAAATQQ